MVEDGVEDGVDGPSIEAAGWFEEAEDRSEEGPNAELDAKGVTREVDKAVLPGIVMPPTLPRLEANAGVGLEVDVTTRVVGPRLVPLKDVSTVAVDTRVDRSTAVSVMTLNAPGILRKL